MARREAPVCYKTERTQGPERGWRRFDPAVDEFLRFESSNQLGNRRAPACEVGGVALEAGAW